MIIRLLRLLHRHWSLFAVFICFSLFYPFLAAVSGAPDRHFRFIVRCRRAFVLLSSLLSGFFYRFRYEQPVDWSRPYIIVANHTSNLDISALVWLIRADFSFVGKHTLRSNPVTGIFFKTIDIPVDRSSKMSSYRAYKRAQELVKQGRSVVFFPEGGIADEYPPPLQPFKNGAFKLAIELQIPILPVIIQDSWQLFWDDAQKLGSKPGICRIDVLRAIETTDIPVSRADELRDQVRQLFNEQWAAHSTVTNAGISSL